MEILKIVSRKLSIYPDIKYGGSSLVAKLCVTLPTPQTVACQTPVPMGFPRQEYWNGLQFPSPGDLTDPRIEPGFPACRQIFYWLSHQGSPQLWIYQWFNPLSESQHGTLAKLFWCHFVLQNHILLTKRLCLAKNLSSFEAPYPQG